MSKRIGSVEVIGDYDYKCRTARVQCICQSCGRTYIAYKRSLQKGWTQKCKFCREGIDPIELRNGSWIVEDILKNGNGMSQYKCACRKCGKTVSINQPDFKNMDRCSCEADTPSGDMQDYFDSFKL